MRGRDNSSNLATVVAGQGAVWCPGAMARPPRRASLPHMGKGGGRGEMSIG